MEIFIPIVVIVIFFILFSICGWCCKRKREGTVFGYAGASGVTVTQTHVTATPVVAAPYPVVNQSGQPHAPGFSTHTTPYPTHPSHPLPGDTPPVSPSRLGFSQHTVPYPLHPAHPTPEDCRPRSPLGINFSSPPYPTHSAHPMPQDSRPRSPMEASFSSPPYPIHSAHPLPQDSRPRSPLGTNFYSPSYQTHSAYPLPQGYQATSGVPPYPPAGGPPYPTGPTTHDLPPSYFEAVGQPNANPPPPINEGYVKQAPYNPHYQ